MRLALAVLAYLCGAGALIVTAVAGYQIMVPADPAAVTTASSVPPPRSEPKRVEPIRPVNEPVQTPTPKYEVTGVPISATAAYNKKKAKEQYGQRSTQRKHRTPKISNEAANAYGSNAYGWGQSYAPPPRRRGDWSIY
jgi:hypothetical protein